MPPNFLLGYMLFLGGSIPCDFAQLVGGIIEPVAGKLKAAGVTR